jgi:glucose-6-phosphate isomerase
MRYELTLMFPDAIGRERAKTLGHLHSFPPGSALNYAEVCEVLHGTAYFVFETMDIKTRQCHFCAYVEAHPGDKVIIPPNLHHLTINAGDEPLLFADVIPLAVKGIYDPLKEMHGAAYYYTLDGIWMPNPHYVSEAAMEPLEIKEYPDLSLTSDKPLYALFSESPDRLQWLLYPERFQSVFPDLWKIVERADALGKSG